MQTTSKSCPHARQAQVQQDVCDILNFHKPGLLALLSMNEQTFAALQAMSQKGVTHAKYYVALCQRYGFGTSQDLQESLVNLLEAALAKHPFAMYELSLCYLYGIGTTQNRVVASSYCQEACDKNFARARSLHTYLNRCKVPNFDEDQVSQAFKHASLNHATAFCTLADAYFCGSGMHQDDELAVEFYTVASHLNDASALTSLGFCYLNGRGVEQAHDTAMMYYYKAAIQNHAIAQHTLAAAYKHGIGVPKSMQLSNYWLEHAIRNGYSCK